MPDGDLVPRCPFVDAQLRDLAPERTAPLGDPIGTAARNDNVRDSGHSGEFNGRFGFYASGKNLLSFTVAESGMTDFRDRIKFELERKGWTATQLVRRAGLKKDKTYKYLSGNRGGNRPDPVWIEAVAKALGVSVAWLLLGEEAQRQDDLLARLKRLPVVKMEQLTIAALKQSEDIAMVLSEAQAADVFAGIGPRAFMLRLTDDAMGKVLPNGSYVVCDPDQKATPGRYVIAATPDGGVCRRYRLHADGGGELIAEHPDFPPLKVGLKGPNIIIGRVVMSVIWS